MGLVVDHLALCTALEGLTYGANEDQRCRADLVSMLENLCVDFQLGLQSGVFRLGEVFLTSSPLLISHFAASLWPFQPLLIYHH